MDHSNRHWRLWWTFWIVVSLGLWAVILTPFTRAESAWTEDYIASTWYGMWGAPRLETTATCQSSGHQAVWVAQTGTRFLDIIQVGSMDGDLFYAYGRGVPNGEGSLYVEKHLGPSGTGPHRYGLSLSAHVWTISIDGRTVARIPDAFRTWRLQDTQVMAEGELPFGPVSCVLPVGRWYSMGYGPQPVGTFGARWWRVRGED